MPYEQMLGAAGLAGFAAVAGAVILGSFLVSYLFIAVTFYFLAKKLKTEPLWLAWVPIAQFFLLPIMAGKHWAWGFIMFVPLANIIFMYIWLWLVYEKRKYPGWWALFSLGAYIPFVGFVFSILALVLYLLVVFKDK
ncbi:MAG TPA: hypothetical protein ENN46_03960 [Candidatus Woesearchaeota archaeon]|nr:hypothetical protein [Candidatus Woesearchaeota archaeon]